MRLQLFQSIKLPVALAIEQPAKSKFAQRCSWLPSFAVDRKAVSFLGRRGRQGVERPQEVLPAQVGQLL